MIKRLSQILATFTIIITAQISPADESIWPIKWTEEELQKDIAVRNISKGTSSLHAMRLAGKEFPHYHDEHDLEATILSGKVKIHFKEHAVVLEPDSAHSHIKIPKGTYHWAENLDPNASELDVKFTPAFDGKDRRRAEPE